MRSALCKNFWWMSVPFIYFYPFEPSINWVLLFPVYVIHDGFYCTKMMTPVTDQMYCTSLVSSLSFDVRITDYSVFNLKLLRCHWSVGPPLGSLLGVWFNFSFFKKFKIECGLDTWTPTLRLFGSHLRDHVTVLPSRL